MPRIAFKNWSVLGNSVGAVGAGLDNVTGGGTGWSDTGNAAGQPVFWVNSGVLRNDYNGNNPGTYYFDAGSLCVQPDNALLFEDGQGFVKWSSAARMGLVFRAGDGTAGNKQSIAVALIDGTFYVFHKNSAGSTQIVYTQTTSVSIPSGGILRGKVQTDGTNVVVRVAICSTGAIDLSNPATNPDEVSELDFYQVTLNCSSIPKLLDPGAAGVWMFNSGQAVQASYYVPSVELTAGVVSLNKASHKNVRLNITGSTGGDGLGVTIDLYRNGVLIAAGIASGNYNDTTVQPYKLYSYYATYTDGTGTVQSKTVLIMSQPAECEVRVYIGDSNIATFGDVPDTQKAPALYANWLSLGGRPNLTINRAVAGTSSQDWATDVAGRLTAAIADIVLYGSKRLTVHLGTNDLKDLATVSGPRTAAAYKANQLSIATTVWASVPDAIVEFSVMPYIPDGTTEWSATGQALQAAYLAKLLEIEAENPGKVVVLNPDFLADSQTNATLYGLVANVHLGVDGQKALTESWKANHTDITYPSAGGSGGTLVEVTTPTPAPIVLTKAAYVKIGSSGETISVQFLGGTAIVKFVSAGGAVPAADKVGIRFRDMEILDRKLTGVDAYAIAVDGTMNAQVTK